MSAALRRKSEAASRGIHPPTQGTLNKYGMTADDWLALIEAQGWKCPICQKRTGVKWVTDHQHTPRWKHMEPAERKRFVRGILCSYCNHRRVHSHIDAAEAQRIADYFKQYEIRRDA